MQCDKAHSAPTFKSRNENDRKSHLKVHNTKETMQISLTKRVQAEPGQNSILYRSLCL